MNSPGIRLLSLLLLMVCASTKAAFAQETPNQEAPQIREGASATGAVQRENTLHAGLFLNLEYAKARPPGDLSYQRRRGQSSGIRRHRGRRNRNFHWCLLSVSPLRPSQARTVDVFCPHWACDHRRRTQLQSQDCPSGNRAVTSFVHQTPLAAETFFRVAPSNGRG